MNTNDNYTENKTPTTPIPKPTPTGSRYLITHQRTGIVIADRATVASGIVERMVGLLSRSSLSHGEALIIPHCNNIHTYFMRFSIDVIFIKTDTPHSAVVVKVVQGVKPFRVVWAAGADTVLELPLHTVSRTRTQVGARLLIANTSD